MKKTMIAALVAATLLTGGAVAAVQNDLQAQDAPKHRWMHDRLSMADADKDGVVTRAETIAAVDARFAKLDANKDGKITTEERQAARAAMGREGRDKRGPGGPGMKRGPDANGDGIVTLDEQRAQALKRFDFVDRDGDGRADQAERALVREMLMEMGGPGRGHHGRNGRRHGGENAPATSARGA
ncbi:MAG: ca2+ sensor protein [Sphingomonadales bacterium]|nr:MAG: ca2+ sensor protein [Sphingomonadales bacterium]